MSKTKMCPCCLVAGRLLRKISECSKLAYFSNILSDIGVQEQGVDLYVCWECEARISSAVKFRRQVKACYDILENDFQNESVKARLPHLRITSVRVDTYLPDGDTEDAGKIEEAWVTEASAVRESENTHVLKTENFSDDENQPVEHFRNVEEELQFEDRSAINNENFDTNKPRKKRKHKNLFKVIKITEMENDRDRKEIENSEPFKTSNYRCNTCMIVFDEKNSLEVHMKNKHNENNGIYRCAICKTVFDSEKALKTHSQKHLRRYECLICRERSTNKRSALHHYKTTHIESIDYMDVKNVSNEENNKPENNAKAEQYECNSCSKIFKWRASLRKHLEMHRIASGETETPQCDICKLKFKSTDCLQRHIVTSIKHQIKVKMQEAKGSSAEEVAEATRAAREASARFACTHCDARFLYKGNLNRHITSHKARTTGELYCQACDKRFSSPATYSNHMSLSKRHAPGAEAWRHECAECGKRFADRRKLNDHVDFEHLKRYTHKCQTCDKVFKSGTSLYIHKTTVHNGNKKDHLCHHCARPFKNAQRLRSHMTAHHSTGRAYKCKQCSATFVWQSCLSRHVKAIHMKSSKSKGKSKEALAGS